MQRTARAQSMKTARQGVLKPNFVLDDQGPLKSKSFDPESQSCKCQCSGICWVLLGSMYPAVSFKAQSSALSEFSAFRGSGRASASFRARPAVANGKQSQAKYVTVADGMRKIE